MANSRFEYVKKFELLDAMMPSTYIVVRIDGRGFHKFCDDHKYTKPNDVNGINLMNQCAVTCMEEYADCCFGFGESDEFSFVLDPATKLFNRRKEKILTTFVSLFTSSFVFLWPKFFPNTNLLYPPSFDGRIVLYPSFKILRDYLSWRQADTHINNLYNTCFWSLVEISGLSTGDAEKKLRGTNSGDKNELLFSQFNINYNDLPAMYRKGSVLFKQPVISLESDPSEEIKSSQRNSDEVDLMELADKGESVRTNEVKNHNSIVQLEESSTPKNRNAKKKNKKAKKYQVVIQHVDIISERFWADLQPIPIL